MGDLLAAFLAGVASTVAPCILPLYPGFLAYLTGGGRVAIGTDGAAVAAPRFPPVLAAALVLAGVMTGMLLIAGVVIMLSASLSRLIPIILPAADVLLIGLGLLLIGGINPFARLPQPSPAFAGGRGPVIGAFAYGLLFAPIAIPCIGPFLLAIFAFSLTIGDALSQLAFFAAFGLGFGVPLFVIGLLGQWRGAQLARLMVRHERTVQFILGVVLIGVGAWDLSQNLPQLLARGTGGIGSFDIFGMLQA
jgi:cytochrome c-type biogenesis protein